MVIQNKPKVGVYILTHNRLQTLKIALESVLSQSFKDMEVIISDNSDNNETENAMMDYVKRYNNLRYVHHHDANSSSAHIQKIISENRFELYMLFHDDDEMLFNMVEELYNAANSHPLCSAIAANAYLSTNGKNKLAFKEKNVIINNGNELIARYSAVNMSIAPFPSYLYRKIAVDHIKFDYNKKGGKYCDVSYLVDIANCGPIFYIGKPLMVYNIHESQDSASFDFVKHVQLTNYLLKISGDKTLLKTFRIRHIYTNIVLGYETELLRFRPMVLSLFLRNGAYIYLFKYLVRFIQSRLKSYNL